MSAGRQISIRSTASTPSSDCSRRRITADPRMTSLDHCVLAVSTSSTRRSSVTWVTRPIAGAPADATSSAARQSEPGNVIVLGADTTVVLDGEILGKPRDDEAARRMLARLSGRAHLVMTGVSLRRGAYEVGRVETTSVVFRALTAAEID